MITIRQNNEAFTLVELLVTIAIISTLMMLVLPVFAKIKVTGQSAQSASNIRQLVIGNFAFSADHNGRFCPAQEPNNLKRWHGKRQAEGAVFDATEGFLSPYLGDEKRAVACPLLIDVVTVEEGSFEDGTGGYGYNAAYIGGTPGDPYTAATLAALPHPESTVMFTTTAIAKSEGIQEYAYTEPFRKVSKTGRLKGRLQPSVHFRANGKAIVAWADGHTSLEPPSKFSTINFYGGNNEEAMIGWFGPENQNGLWNPNYTQ